MTDHLTPLVAHTIVHREQRLGVLGRHPDQPRHPHPEECARPSGRDRGRDAGDIPGADGRGECGHERLEVRDLPDAVRVAALDQTEPERGSELPELQAAQDDRQVESRSNEQRNQAIGSPDETRDLTQP